MADPAYYNEIDPYCAAWLRNLIVGGLLPDGDVDERSIKDVQPEDLRGYGQCHFFAGIGGWGLAARYARWPDDRVLWTGSCPCQPFSVAGQGLGAADARHLWPDFCRLIRAVRPPVVMGEQVAGKAGYGWLDGVRVDLAREGHACRGVDIPACAVDAPHIRSRLYWLAMGDAESDRRREGRPEHDFRGGRSAATGAGCGCVGDADSQREHKPQGVDAHERRRLGDTSAQHSAWSGAEWLACPGGKARRVKPGVRLLAHGIPARAARIRAGGNAIVPQEAAEVIRAWMDTCDA